MSFESTFKIRSFHTDSFGHVNNARYLELLEEARWQFAEHLGLVNLLNEENLGFIIMQMNLRFRFPVVEGDTIRVLTSLVSLGSDIGEVEQLIKKSDSGKLAAKMLFTFVLIDRNSGVSVPIAGKIRSLLLSIVQTKRGSGVIP
jgi:thioesterase-3